MSCLGKAYFIFLIAECMTVLCVFDIDLTGQAFPVALPASFKKPIRIEKKFGSESSGLSGQTEERADLDQNPHQNISTFVPACKHGAIFDLVDKQSRIQAEFGSNWRDIACDQHRNGNPYRSDDDSMNNVAFGIRNHSTNPIRQTSQRSNGQEVAAWHEGSNQ